MKQLERMTLKELRQHEERVRAAIVAREQQDRTELRNKVVALHPALPRWLRLSANSSTGDRGALLDKSSGEAFLC